MDDTKVAYTYAKVVHSYGELLEHLGHFDLRVWMTAYCAAVARTSNPTHGGASAVQVANEAVRRIRMDLKEGIVLEE